MKRYFLLMIIINVALLGIGYNQLVVPYKSMASVVVQANREMARVMDAERIRYANDIKVLLDDKRAVSELLVQSQKDLELFYTFQQAGLTANSIDTIRELSMLAQNLPFGSPFRDGHIITDKFGVRDESWFGGDGNHEGIDIISKGSWQIIATADGTVTDFGYNDTYGKYLEYTTDSGYKLIYGHLSKIYWQEGTKVRNIHLTKGARIARMGNTGLTSGPHLHLELQMKNNVDEYVNLDPEAIINYIGG